MGSLIVQKIGSQAGYETAGSLAMNQTETAGSLAFSSGETAGSLASAAPSSGSTGSSFNAIA